MSDALSGQVFERMATVEDEYALIETSLADPELLSDQARLREVSKRYKDLTPLVECLRQHRVKVADVEAAREYMNAATGDERELWRDEAAAAEADVAELETRLRLLMVPQRPERGQGRHHGDPWRRGWRGGEPVRSRPLRDVPVLRRPLRVEGRGALERPQ